MNSVTSRWLASGPEEDCHCEARSAEAIHEGNHLTGLLRALAGARNDGGRARGLCEASGGRVTPSRAPYSSRSVFSSANSNEKTLLLYSLFAPIYAPDKLYRALGEKERARSKEE